MQEKKTLTIDMATTTVGGKKFSAGSCILVFGGIPLDACMATAEYLDEPNFPQKWVSTRDDIIIWLMNRGLPGDRATALVDRTGEFATEQIEVNPEVKE